MDKDGNISVAFTINTLDDNIDFFYRPYGSSDFIFSKTGIGRVSYTQIDLTVDMSGHQYFTTYDYRAEYCLQLYDKENSSPNWTKTLLANGEDLRYGGASSIAIDDAYGIHIAFCGSSNDNNNKLYYLYKDQD